MDRENDGIHFIVFTLDDKYFALPLSHVVRAVRAVEITPLPKAPSIIVGVLNYMGRVIPLLNISERFHLKYHQVRSKDFFIIFDAPKRLLAIHVDTIEDHLQVTHDAIISPPDIYENIEFLAGVLRSSDGVLLIPDMEKILTLQEEKTLEEALPINSDNNRSKNE